jgi:hypothetical protein
VAVTLIGVDLGSLQDFTAIAAVQQVPVKDPNYNPDPMDVALGIAPPPEFSTHFYVRAIERLPLGTQYASIARRVCQLATRVYNKDPKGEQYVLMDATGVGRPVYELVKTYMIPQVHVTAITLTNSPQAQNAIFFRDEAHVGKPFLARRLQIVIQSRRLHYHVADKNARVLDKEMDSYQARITAAAKDQFGAFEQGAHDDVITAVGLCVIEERLQDVAYLPPIV